MKIELIYNINNFCVGYTILPDNDDDKSVIREIIDLHYFFEPIEYQDKGEDCIWDNLGVVGVNRAHSDKSITTFTMIDESLSSDILYEDEDDE